MASNTAADTKAEDKRKRLMKKYAGRMAFSKFVDSCLDSDTPAWTCCNNVYSAKMKIHEHAAKHHLSEISVLQEQIFIEGSPDARWTAVRRLSDGQKEMDEESPQDGLPINFTSETSHSWLPIVSALEMNSSAGDEGLVLLFYKYCDISNTLHVLNWQKELCRRLQYTGKVRIGHEGINATVGGTKKAAKIYISAMQQHPLFKDMSEEDFKSSKGDSTVFPDGLKIGIYQEIVPMGVDKEKVSYKDTASHLTPAQFHQMVDKYGPTSEAKDDAIFIDCRNYYESQIGQFDGAVAPDIRKFSYWPDYVDVNLPMFQNKKVFMYCTGGIRCERGSAYLKSKGIKDIYQLQGGIHKYIEQYPDGHFRGKLFVFDDRYAIKANDDVMSKCHYCSVPWDSYNPCASVHCHQLVLSCEECISKGLIACCILCQVNTDNCHLREECECTKKRPKIPVQQKSMAV